MKILFLFILSVFLFQPDLIILEEYILDDSIVSYGSYLDDAYMMIRDTETEEIYNEIVLDEGLIESFVYLAEVNSNQFIMVLEKFNIDSQEYQYSLYLYNIYGQMIKKKDLVDIPTGFYNHHSVLVLEMDDSYIYINNELEFLDDLPRDTSVVGSYMIQCRGQVIIDGKSVDELKINWPGTYEIVIKEYEYEYIEYVTVEANIEIMGELYKDGYNGDVIIESNGEIYIDGEVITSGTVLSNPGKYEVDIYGENGYVKTFNLKIYPVLQYYDGNEQFDLSNGMVFDYPIRIYSNTNNIKVNGEVYGGDLLRTTGHYLVEITQGQIVIESLNFSMISKLEGVKDQETYEKVKIFAFGEVYINDNKVEGFQWITKPGTYQAEIKENNQVIKKIEFYIVDSNESENKSLIVYGLLLVSVIGFWIIIFKK